MQSTIASKVVIWDFDGVIADTFEMCYSIHRSVTPELTEPEYRLRFEGNINASAVTTRSAEEVDFFAEYDKRILDQRLVRGIKEVVKNLATRYVNVVVSSTITPIIERYLNHHGLREYFVEVLGNEVALSKVAKFKMVFASYHTSSGQCILVTDTLGDLREAQTVGLRAIAVTWGYHDEPTLRRGQPDVIEHEPRGITNDVIERLG